MRKSTPWLGDVLATLFAQPDEVMLELGAGGELLVARIRALLSAICLLLPLTSAIAGAPISETLIGLAAAVFINIMAQLWLALARNPRAHGWLPFATSTYDITTTTAVLVLLALGDRASGLNSLVIWGFYPISIVMTALRNDGRLTLFVTSLAIVQYAMLVVAIIASAHTPEQLVSVDYGTVSMASQIERVVLLLLTGMLTTTIVYRIQRLVELSGRDGLTGLPNRLWLLQQMPRMFDAARASGQSLTLALVDLDRFRRINEEIGARDGDRALRQTAALMAEILDAREHLVRIGGQEFVLLLQCPIGSGWERLDRLRRAVAERPFLPEVGGEPLRITFSAGLVAWPQDGADLSGLLRGADRRLQQAKRDGCNRVIARDV
ncbi:GGDEF domain-containing protein [Cognatiluteimonas telluris]|uniref:GGDEF domain-containing protein n=1 Tax=Cognatiluteimonas telluris TaxID=1104775 RepID=UPI00140BF4DC|nr:GGDEF domain-containing protein [Lysobacter telluris]